MSQSQGVRELVHRFLEQARVELCLVLAPTIESFAQASQADHRAPLRRLRETKHEIEWLDVKVMVKEEQASRSFIRLMHETEHPVCSELLAQSVRAQRHGPPEFGHSALVAPKYLR